jgi:hypothetical protein
MSFPHRWNLPICRNGAPWLMNSIPTRPSRIRMRRIQSLVCMVFLSPLTALAAYANLPLEDRTLQEVRHDLIEMERATSPDSPAEVSLATFVLYGLELEDAQ